MKGNEGKQKQEKKQIRNLCSVMIESFIPIITTILKNTKKEKEKTET